MGHERWFRGQHDGQNRPFDWLTPARQQGVPWRVAQALYEQAVQEARTLRVPVEVEQVQEIYLALLANARQETRRPAPGKVTRTMRLQAERAGERQPVTHVSELTGQPIAPGKVTSTSRLARHERAPRGQARASEIGGERTHVEMMSELFERLSQPTRPMPDPFERTLDTLLRTDRMTGQAPSFGEDASDEAWADDDASSLATAADVVAETPANRAAESENPVHRPPARAGRWRGRLSSSFVRQVARSRGAPLPGALRGRLEQALGADLSGVRVHTGATSNEASREIDALAFTIGEDIHFADGTFDPGSRRGEALLAHEVAHTVQQRGAARLPGDGVPAVSAPGDAHEVEAERFSRQFLQRRMSRAPGALPTRVAAGKVGRAMIHRAPADATLPEPAQPEQPGNEDPLSPQNDEVIPAALTVPEVTTPEKNGSPLPATPAVQDETLATGGDPLAEITAPTANSEQGAEKTLPQEALDTETTVAPEETVQGEGGVLTDDAEDDGPLALDPVPTPRPADEVGPTVGVLAQAAERIRASSHTEKGAFQQEMQEKRAGLQQETEARARQMEAAGKAKLASLLASIAAREAELRSTFSTARASLAQKIAAQKVQARADGATALTALATAIEEKKQAAITAADGEAKLAEEAGAREAQRARQSAASTITSVNSAKSSASGSYASSKEEVRQAVADALATSAREITEDVRKKSDDLAKAAKDGADKTAKSIRAAGKKIADGMQAKSGDAEKAIREGTRATVERIDVIGKEASQQLDTLERKAVAGLSAARNRVTPAIQGATKAAVQRLRSAAREALASLAQAATAALDDFDHATQIALAKLNAAATGDDADPEAVDEFVAKTTRGLTDMRMQGMAALGGQVTTARAGISQVESSFGASLEGAAEQVKALIAQAAADLTQAANLPATVDTQCMGTRKTAKETYDNSIQKFRDEAQKPIDDGKKGWSEQRAKYETEIKGKVDELVAQNQKVASEAPGKFAQTARDAAAKADRSLLSKIWDGIKQGLQAFWDGLKWFLLAFLVVFVIVAIVLAVIAGGISLAILAAAAAIALVIVGVIFLVYGLISALIHRFGQAWDTLGNRPWYEKLLIVTLCSPYFIAVAVGDLLGVTPILEGIFGYDAITGDELSTEERWKRATVGVLTIVTLLVLRRAGKALGPPRIPGRPGQTPPVEPPPPEVVEPRPPEVVEPRPPEVVEPPPPEVVEPRPPEVVEPPPPEVVEPPPPEPPRPTYDPTTRTNAELQLDRSPDLRPGETPAEAAERVRLAEAELLRRAPEIMDALGEDPRRVNLNAEDPARVADDAHTLERHGANIPLRRSDAPPGARTIEGRVHGDPPWGRVANGSARWLSDSIMNRTVNDYIRANWQQIKLDLSLNGSHESMFDAGHVVGEGFFNSGMGGTGPRVAVYGQTSSVRITIILDAGPPVDFFVLTTFPNILGTPPGG